MYHELAEAKDSGQGDILKKNEKSYLWGTGQIRKIKKYRSKPEDLPCESIS